MAWWSKLSDTLVARERCLLFTSGASLRSSPGHTNCHCSNGRSLQEAMTTVDDYSPHDQQIWDEELQDFVPERVFDAHIHLFHPDHLAANPAHVWGHTDLATLRQWAARLYPGRETHFLVLGTPIQGIDVAAHNWWCIEQV